MIPLTLAQVAAAVEGRLIRPVVELQFDAVCTDSRAVSKGSLFIALRGDRFDAHDFLPQVAAAGAAAVVIDRAETAVALEIPAIVVSDTRKALGELGGFVRSLAQARIVAIGGSNGKTTTKHLVGSVLGAQLRGTQSPKSFNNDIGVPLTLLGIGVDDDYAVLELGTNHPGELAPLSRMARPDIAVITSIGPEHLEGFGNLDGVRKEEAALLAGLVADGVAIINGDDPQLLQAVLGRTRRLRTFGFAPSNDLVIDTVASSLSGIRFTVRGTAEGYCLPLPGRHNASNALAAIAVGREFGIADAVIRAALSDCSRPEMRMQIVRVGSITVLNDAYNANPASMRAALDTLAEADVPGRRIAVLGEMRELGNCAEAMHREIGVVAGGSRLDTLICVGEGGERLADAAIAAGFESRRVHRVADSTAAAEYVPSLLCEGDTILLKASRGVKLELVAEAIQRRWAGSRDSLESLTQS